MLGAMSQVKKNQIYVYLLKIVLIFTGTFVLIFDSSYAAISGYGSFGGTTTTAPSNISNLNQDNPYAIRWTQERFDSTYFDHDTSSFNHEITVKVSGHYRLNLVIPLDEVSGSNRRSIRSEVFINGSAIDIGRAESSYIRDSNDHTGSSLHLNTILPNLSVNDVIEVRVSKQTNRTGDVVTPGAQLFLKYVDPSSKVMLLKGSESTSGTSLHTSSESSLLWEESALTNTAFTHSTVTNANEITLNESGSYRVSVNIPLQDPSSCPGNNRTSVKALIRLDGALVNSGAATQGYMRCSDDHQFSSLHYSGYLNGVSAGQKIRIGLIANTNVTASVVIPSGKKASIALEKVDSSTKLISLTGTSLTSGNNWNETSGGSVRWTNQQVKDASIFTHSTSSSSHQITFAESGDYLVTYGDYLTSGVQRANPAVQLRLNNSLPDGAECRTHYIRNQNNHDESSCSLVYLLENVSSGDVLEVALSASAETGTVNDVRPAELHIYQISAGEPILDIANIPNKDIHFDMSSNANVLDSSNRNANDLSFSNTVQTAVDISGSEFPHNGVQTNASRQPTFDKVTKVLNFDGSNDFFEIANADDINTATATERTFAIVLRTGPDITTRQMIYEEGGTVRGINVYIRNGSLYLGFWNDRNDGDGRQSFVSTNTTIQANTNYYVTLVYDYSNYTGPSGPNGNLRGTINGTPFNFSGSTTSRLFPHSGAIGLGAMNNDTCYDTGCVGGDGDYFQGDIFEFVMYNAAISPALEQEYYNFLAEKWPDPFPVTNLELASQYTDDSGASPLITWNASISTDIDHYEIALGTTPGDDDFLTYTDVGNVTSTTLSGLSLNECVEYYASVKSVDPEPKESTIVTTSFFKYDGTSPTDPTGLVLSGGASSDVSKTLSWTGVTDNCAFERYEVALGTSSGASDIVTWTDVGAELSHQFSGLTLADATDYYMSVRAIDSAGNLSAEISSAAWQVDSCVASDVTSPTNPTNLSLAGIGGTTSSPTLNWDQSSDGCGLSHYEVAIGSSAGASDIVSFSNVGDVSTYRFTALSTALNTNTNYYLSLKAVDLAGNESSVQSSGVWSLPAPGTVSSGLALWLDAADISSLFQNSNCSSSPVTNDGDAVGCWLDKSQNGNNLTAASNNARPTFQTNEFNGNGVIRFDGNNDALDFTAITNMRTVFVVNKSNETSYQPFFGHTSNTDWFTNDNSLVSSSASASLRNGTWRVNKSNISNPQLTTQTGQYSLYSVVSTGNVRANHIASDRKNNGRFFGGDVVEVIVYDRALSESEVENVENYLFDKWFSSAPGALSGLSLSSNFTSLNNTSPNLTWNHSQASDFNYYEIALGKNENSNDVAGWFNIGGNNNYAFTGTLLEECVDLYISVRAVDTDGLTGESSSSDSFVYDGTSPTTPASLSLSGNASPSLSKTLTWANATDSCSSLTYELSLGTSAGAQDTVVWSDVGNINSYQFSGLSLAPATDYFINIRAKDSAGNLSAVATSEAFQVTNCVLSDTTDPLAPTSINLSGNAKLQESPSFSWVAGSDACAFSHHEVSLGTSSGGNQIVDWTNIGTNTSHQFNNLASNLSFDTDYYFNVRSVDQAGNISSVLSSASWQLKGPASVSATGLSMWIDVDDRDTLFRNDDCTVNVIHHNHSIGCATDLSGNSNHLTVNASANKPTLKNNSFNGKRSLYFDGSTNEYLEFTSRLTDIRTVFWVIKEDTSNLGTLVPILGDPSGGTTDFARGATGGAFFNNSTSSTLVRNGTLRLNKNAINGTSISVPSSESVVSLVTTGNVRAGSFTQDTLACCGNRTFGGKLAELIIYNRALNGTEVEAVEDYLMTKWNLVNTTTEWLGSVNTDWNNAGNWSNGVPTPSLDCIIADRGNDPIISSGTATCKNLAISDGILTFQNGGNVDLEIYGNISIQTGALVSNDGEVIVSDDGALLTNQTLDFNNSSVNLSFSKSAGGQVELEEDTLFTSFSMPSGSNFSFNVNNGVEADFSNGLVINGGTFVAHEGSILDFNAGSSLTLNAGLFQTSGLNDSLGSSGQDLSRKVMLTSSNGRWSFIANGGVVSLTGFILNNLNNQGLQIIGNANLSNLDGGQFTNLHKDYTTPTRAITLNTTEPLSESVAVNIGFNWGSANTGYAGDPTPSDNYYTVYASNCGGGTLVFDQWFGDFWGDPIGFDTENKIFDNADGGNCGISMDIAVSPVTLTEFNATAYDESVVIEWETGSELNHLGFNLYRSTDPDSGYVQINNELIRNYLTSGEFRGRYRFVDPNLSNNQVYYYILEDVATNGDRDQYGPEFAIPQSALGAVPNDNDPDLNTPINDPGSINLGGGVAILTQTQGSLRVSITPGSVQMTNSAWDGNYVDVSLPGYTKFSEAGFPELLNRKILIPVDDTYSNVQATIFSQANSDLSGLLAGKKITPAPSFTANGDGELIPSYSEDNFAYAQNTYDPPVFFNVKSSTVSLLGKNYVEITVNPLRYIPTSNALDKLDQIVLDIGLEGSAWDYVPPSDIYQVSPSVAEGTLNIEVQEAGIYSIEFSEIAAINAEGPFLNKPIENLRLYSRGKEIALRVDSGDGLFGSGDRLVFYAPYFESLYDQKNILSLSTYDFNVEDGASEDALRIESYQPQASHYDDLIEENAKEIIINDNTYAVFDVPVGIFEDHLLLKRIFTSNGGGITGNSSYQKTIPLTDISPSAQFVRLSTIVSTRGVLSENPDHHLELSINGVAVESKVFKAPVPTSIIFDVPLSYFVSGNNTIRLTALGDKVKPGDFDMLDIEEIRINYSSLNERESLQQSFSSGAPGSKFLSSGYQSDSIEVFDVTNENNIFQYSEVFVDSFDGNTSYDVSYKILGNGLESEQSQQVIVEDEEYFSAASLALSPGVETILKNSQNEIDYLVVADKNVLSAAKRLVEYRETQGLNGLAVSFDQVYGEFSHSIKDPYALNRLLTFAKKNWSQSPRYLLIIDDASYDPNDDLGWTGHQMNPVALYKGTQNDFGSDVALGLESLGTDEESAYSDIAIGRLPSRSLSLVEGYVQKIIDYESGTRAPQTNVKKAVFIAGESDENENFLRDVSSLEETYRLSNKELTAEVIDANSLTDAEVLDDLNTELSSSPLLITYMGHGAEDLWGLNGFFDTSHAQDLNNNELPIMMGLGCLNSYYYDPDTSWTSLAEELVLNPNGGAIAFYGSTTLTSPQAQRKLATESLNRIGQNLKTAQTNSRLGEMMTTALRVLGNNSIERDMSMSWTLFGDPALKLPSDAFSEPEPAPASAAPRGSAPSSGGGGCSAFAGSGQAPVTLMDWIAFLCEVLFYCFIYRSRRKLFLLWK